MRYGAYAKDAWRTSLGNSKRFASIAIITMLGVAVLTGIYAGCRGAFVSAGRFYERQRLYDIQVTSATGLSDDDVKALAGVEGVETVQPERSAMATTTVKDVDKNFAVTRIGTKRLNQPYLQRGRIPATTDEVAVTERYMLDSGAKLGDKLALTTAAVSGVDSDGAAADTGSADGSSHVSTHGATTSRPVITGVVLDPQDLDNPAGYRDGTFRRASTVDYTVFVTDLPAPADELAAASAQGSAQGSAEDSAQGATEGSTQGSAQDLGQQRAALPAYAAISLRVSGANELDTFSSSYRDHVGRVVDCIESLPEATTGGWYVNDRTEHQNFSGLTNDLRSIESIGRAFPVVFLAVAVLMSLTAMTRMVEEHRGLIGTYLALGYGKGVIVLRYLLFSGVACLVGGGLGELVGFIGIPVFLMRVIGGLYVIPHMTLTYDLLYGLGGLALFLVAVCGATVMAVMGEARRMPASLMRPKAPKAGARMLLERIGWLWRRMSFLNKVTARNLFRFKGRLIMTVGGVAGCTALILCGLAINDTVASLGQRQYGGIYRYDLMAVAQDGRATEVLDRLQNDKKVTAMVRVRVEAAELSLVDKGSGSGSESVQVVVVPDGEDLSRMVDLREARGGLVSSLGLGWTQSAGPRLKLGDDGMLVAQSAANSLGIKQGSTVDLRIGSVTRTEARVDAVFRSLIGADVYMSRSVYEAMIDAAGQSGGSGESGGQAQTDGSGQSGAETKPFVVNAALATLSGDRESHKAFATTLGREDGVVSSLSSAALADGFSFDLMSAVMALIAVLAGGLALVVLFTLANTNVSERLREMATIKVLGFTDREVHRYVNKEMVILTAIGTLLGLPLGRLIGGLLAVALNMPSLYFEVRVQWTSYLIAAGVTLAFAGVVQLFTNPVLDRIDPVSSLKSVE